MDGPKVDAGIGLTLCLLLFFFIWYRNVPEMRDDIDVHAESIHGLAWRLSSTTWETLLILLIVCGTLYLVGIVLFSNLEHEKLPLFMASSWIFKNERIVPLLISAPLFVAILIFLVVYYMRLISKWQRLKHVKKRPFKDVYMNDIYNAVRAFYTYCRKRFAGEISKDEATDRLKDDIIAAHIIIFVAIVILAYVGFRTSQYNVSFPQVYWDYTLSTYAALADKMSSVVPVIIED